METEEREQEQDRDGKRTERVPADRDQAADRALFALAVVMRFVQNEIEGREQNEDNEQDEQAREEPTALFHP